MTRDAAQVVALQAVGFLAATDDLVSVFMGATGIAREDLIAGIETPEVQAAVLDFVLMDDQWVLAFAKETGQPPEAIALARASLPGGEDRHWT
ncbi:DUF3572 domain-containing protein [Fluviibacterium sp. DFM31]|uniref:DUF3572 domain-containing protein n=1 Tax=Meridianimarinicoccus marinus TaxID=3231483 RepID=A0ABV3L1V0_9RHOB